MNKVLSNAAPKKAELSLGDELEALLEGLSRQYRVLEAHVESQREAIRRADGAAVQSAAEAQTRAVGALGLLEQKRRELVAAACAGHAPLAGKRSVAITLTDLAECVGEPRRGELRRKAQELKSQIASVQQQTSTIRSATVSLLAHMEGMMRQVARQLSHAGTYSNRGYVEAGGVVVSSLDLST